MDGNEYKVFLDSQTDKLKLGTSHFFLRIKDTTKPIRMQAVNTKKSMEVHTQYIP